MPSPAWCLQYPAVRVLPTALTFDVVVQESFVQHLIRAENRGTGENSGATQHDGSREKGGNEVSRPRLRGVIVLHTQFFSTH